MCEPNVLASGGSAGNRRIAGLEASADGSQDRLQNLSFGRTKTMKPSLGLLTVLLCTQSAIAQNKRDQAVRADKREFAKDASWFYDDLETATRAAAKAKRPMMIVFR